MFNFFNYLNWLDLFDIALLSFIFYRIFVFIRGTRAIPMLTGFFLLLGLYLLSRFFNLVATGLLLDRVANSLVLVLVILFQSDIRNALAQFGLITFFKDNSGQFKRELVEESLQACAKMANQRIGALIVFEKELGLRNYIEKGTEIDAKVSQDLLVSIFHTSSPLHDGAVIINRKGRLIAARCLLPITMNTKLSPILGTRHRAAVGITEETDAVVLVVSEERSEISVVHKGRLTRESQELNLKDLIFTLVQGQTEESEKQKDGEPVNEPQSSASTTTV